MKRILAVLLATSVAACAPIVTHSPRVEGGTRLVATAGGSATLCDDARCDLALLPQVSLGIRAGRPAGAANAGFSVGAKLALNLLSSDVDMEDGRKVGSQPVRFLLAGVIAQGSVRSLLPRPL